MARIDYCDTTKSNERTKEILGKNRNANIFRMMAHSPSYFEQYCRLGGAIRHKGELDPVVRELAITRTGILCEAPYEIVAHKRIGKNVGVTDEQNEALENWQSATCFNEVQRAALAFTDEIVGLHKPTDATFNAIAAKLTPAALVELQLSVGFYIMTSKFLETFGIDMQPVSRWFQPASIGLHVRGAACASLEAERILMPEEPRLRDARQDEVTAQRYRTNSPSADPPWYWRRSGGRPAVARGCA